MAEAGKFQMLFDEFKTGGISRRVFLERALALGVGFGVATFVANAAFAAPGQRKNGFAVVNQDGAAARPAVGMEGKTRGQGGELKILQWQASTLLNPHVATGTKDYLAGCLVFEPMMSYLPDGTIVPNLIAAVPTVDNGMLAEDLTTATFTLLPGLLWNDGTPVTAADIVYTWMWITDHPDTLQGGAATNSSVSRTTWAVIANIEAVDDLTARVTYTGPNVNWFSPFTGTSYGYIMPKHILEQEGGANTLLTNPVGTGPYVVTSFTPNDQVIYEANANFRDPNKPFFQTVNLKGGGDAASAARAVLQTGDWDHAWNLQVEPSVVADLAQGGAGTFYVVPGTSVERINVNFSDPNTELDGQRSHKDVPHPFMSDLAVRQAMALSIRRDLISTQFYAGPPGEPPTSNQLVGLPAFASPNTSWTVDHDEANRILDEAGWVRDGDTRTKDGVELNMTYSTSINAVRQKTQAVIKEDFEAIGIKVQLQQVDSGIFFDASAGNEQNIGHFYTDINMYTNGAGTPVPTDYMIGWYAGENGNNIAQRENTWNGQNFGRWVNAEYDALYDELITVTDLEQAAQILIQMNDLIINDVATIPLVNRAADKYAHSNRLVHDNVGISSFELNYWNIVNWCTVE